MEREEKIEEKFQTGSLALKERRGLR